MKLWGTASDHQRRALAETCSLAIAAFIGGVTQNDLPSVGQWAVSLNSLYGSLLANPSSLSTSLAKQWRADLERNATRTEPGVSLWALSITLTAIFHALGHPDIRLEPNESLFPISSQESLSLAGVSGHAGDSFGEIIGFHGLIIDYASSTKKMYDELCEKFVDEG